MYAKSKVTLTAVVGAALGILITPFAAIADNVPDALSVEWQGKKPCEKVFEDTQVLVARCTLPPGTAPLPPVLRLLRAEWRPGTGARRQGHAEDRSCNRRFLSVSPGPVACVYQHRSNDVAIPNR